MHIVLGILSALAIVIYIVIRMGQVARAGRELGEAASDVRKLVRKKSWQRKLTPDLIKQIDDPRLAATAMMCAVAQSEGAVTEEQKQAILGHLSSTFELSGVDAEEMLAEGRWLTSDSKDLSSFLARASGPITAACTVEERRELLDMLRQIAAVEGGPSEIQTDAITRLEHRLGLAQ